MDKNSCLICGYPKKQKGYCEGCGHNIESFWRHLMPRLIMTTCLGIVLGSAIYLTWLGLQ